MAFVLNGTTIDDPTSFKESWVVTGEMNYTLEGGVRRAIRAKKRIWTLTWNMITEENYNTIKTIYDLDTSVSFANSSLTPSISTTVHVDLRNRDYIGGTGKYLSVIDLVLTEV